MRESESKPWGAPQSEEAKRDELRIKAQDVQKVLAQRYGLTTHCHAGGCEKVPAKSHPSITRILGVNWDDENWGTPWGDFYNAQNGGHSDDGFFIRSAHARRIHRKTGRFPTEQERQRLGFMVVDEEYDIVLPSKDDLPEEYS